MFARLTLRPRADTRGGGTFKSFSLRAHMLAVVLVAIMPALLVALVIGANASRAAEQARQERLADTAHALAGAVDQEFEHAIATLTTLAANAGLEQGGDMAEFITRARMAAEATGTEVSLRRPDGPFPPQTPDLAITPQTAPSIATLAAQVLDTGAMAVSDVTVTGQSGMPVAAIIVPVIHNTAVIGTVEMLIPSDRLTAALRHQSIAANGLAVLVDPQGRVAAASHDVAQLAGQILPPAIGAATGSTAPSSARLLCAPGWRVLYSEERKVDGFALTQDLSQSALAVLVAGVLSVILITLLSTRLARPLRDLSELARNVAIGNERPMDTTAHASVAEFEELGQGLLRADAVLRRRGAAERMALREARTGHELLVSVVNGTAESIHVKDLELRYVLVNRAALLSGSEPRAEWQVLGRSTANLFPPEVARRIEAADRKVLATGRMTSFEQEYTPADGEGEQRWVAMTITPWQDADGRVVGVVSVSRDITLKRQHETRLRTMQAELLRATRLSAMGAMASGLAHELNQPLAAATNYLNAGGRLLDRSVVGDEVAFRAARGAVADAAQQLLRAGAIVRRLRDFVERGEAELQTEDVGELLRETCDLARTDGVTTGIDLSVALADTAGHMMVDRTQIQQVLLNLIRNAAEAIDSSSSTPDHGEISVHAGPGPDGGMRIEVRDNGPGLVPGIAERLFEPFVSSKRTGMGIGLAICRTIIEGHGGQLTAEPNDGGGMVFRIALPALHPYGDPT